MDPEQLRQHYESLLITQYRIKDKAKKTIMLMVNQVLADGLPGQLARAFDLDTAKGNQLDILGRIVGVPRKVYGLDLDHSYFSFIRYDDTTTRIGFGRYAYDPYPQNLWLRYITDSIFSMSDFEMSQIIRIKIIQNNSYSSLKEIADALYANFGIGLRIIDNKDMTIHYHATEDYKRVIAIAEYLDILPRPMGVDVTTDASSTSSSSCSSSSSCRSSSSSSSCRSSSSSSSSCRSSSSSSCRSSSSSSSCRSSSSSSSSSCRSSSSSCSSSSSRSSSSSSSSFSATICVPGNDQYTMLLLKGNGVNGSPFVQDSSNFIRTVTSFGITNTTAQAVFNSSSLYFPGASNYLSIPDSEDWNFGNGNFTIDAWVRPTAWGGAGGPRGVIWSQVQGDADYMQLQLSPTGFGFAIWTTAGGLIFGNGTSGTINLDTWYHVAVVRSGNNWIFFIDGVGSTVVSSITFPNYSAAVEIGRLGGSYASVDPGYFSGYIDEFRVTKGVARWTSNFTPPTLPYCGYGSSSSSCRSSSSSSSSSAA